MQKLLLACLLLCLPTVTRAQWSVFDPLSEIPPPATDDPQWAAPVDAYVHAQLREAKLVPAPVTSRTAWIRRVSYDLTGLPPAPHEVQTFLADKRPDAAAMEEVGGAAPPDEAAEESAPEAAEGTGLGPLAASAGGWHSLSLAFDEDAVFAHVDGAASAVLAAGVPPCS